MTKDEARAWMSRWDAVRERERRDLVSQTYEERLEALAVLMASQDLFDFSTLDAEDAMVRARWAKLQALAAKR